MQRRSQRSRELVEIDDSPGHREGLPSNDDFLHHRPVIRLTLGTIHSAGREVL